MLDVDLTLDALAHDALHTSHLYAVRSKPSVTERINNSAKINGNTLDAKRPGAACVKTANGSHSAKGNGKRLQLETELPEESLTETFGHFGAVERILLPAKAGKHSRHAYISEQNTLQDSCSLSQVLFVRVFAEIVKLSTSCVFHRVWESRGQTRSPQAPLMIPTRRTTSSVHPWLRPTCAHGRPWQQVQWMLRGKTRGVAICTSALR